MSERDFHAEAVCRVAEEVAEKHPVPRPITWVELRINEDDTQACLVQIAVREYERNLRGDDLIRQMVETLKNFPKFTEVCAVCPHGEEPDYCVCCDTDYGEAVLAWKQKRDEQVAKAEKYLEGK